jgi:thioredoxin reductase (NADPH)
MKRKVIIIGSGPAGYTAAIYASRAGLSPLMFAGLKHGGQLMDTGDVENFPGYRNPVTGPELMEDIRLQAERFGTEISYKMIIKAKLDIYPFVLTDEDNQDWITDSVIISTGAEAKWLGIDSEKKYYGRGVSACATCDGFFFKNKKVVVIGGGDTACEEALYLSNICSKVVMLVRSDRMRASKIMYQRVINSTIDIKYNTQVIEFLGDGDLTGISTNQGNIVCDGVFIAIGHKPNTELFTNQLDIDDDGYIITMLGSTKTNIPGVFACGDVQDKIYRQAITAAGTGCMAAIDAEKFLSQVKDV